MDTYFLIGLSWLAWLVLGYYLGRKKSKKMEYLAYDQGSKRGESRKSIFNDDLFSNKN